MEITRLKLEKVSGFGIREYPSMVVFMENDSAADRDNLLSDVCTAYEAIIGEELDTEDEKMTYWGRGFLTLDLSQPQNSFQDRAQKLEFIAEDLKLLYPSARFESSF